MFWTEQGEGKTSHTYVMVYSYEMGIELKCVIHRDHFNLSISKSNL